MLFVYLDSYYFYAPIPRVVVLREKLSEKCGGSCKLLFEGFSSPKKFIDTLERFLQQRKYKVMIQDILRGRRRSVKIDLVNLSMFLGDENAALLDFILYEARLRETEERKTIYCDSSTKLKVTRDLVKHLRDYAWLLANVGTLYQHYQEYMLCRTCKLIGIKYPGDVIRENIRQYAGIESSLSIIEERCPCKEQCRPGRDDDDVKRALGILNFFKRRGGDKVIIVGTWRDECFSCLASCLAESLLSNAEFIEKPS